MGCNCCSGKPLREERTTLPEASTQTIAFKHEAQEEPIRTNSYLTQQVPILLPIDGDTILKDYGLVPQDWPKIKLLKLPERTYGRFEVTASADSPSAQ